MPESPDKPAGKPPIGELRLSPEFEPNTLVYDADTATPPRLGDLDARLRGRAVETPLAPPRPDPKLVDTAPPAPKSSQPDPERVAHFRILGRIGEGGMGTVFRANDEYLQRLVALKVLNVGEGNAGIDEEQTQRLLREARAASRISHRNVVTVYAAGDFEGIPFIAMEYVEGQELGKMIGLEGLDTERALEIAVQIAEGLGAAHEQGIVHRDVKPANVLVCAGDSVKILDFGLAKPVRIDGYDAERTRTGALDAVPDSASALDFYNTQAGVIWGSLRYMSPEQLTGEPLDARTDVFSLGVVFYQMLTGQLPFFANRPKDQLRALMLTDPAPLKKFRMRVPESVQAIVTSALSRDKDLRFANGGAMAAELRTALSRLREFGDVELEDLATTVPTGSLRRETEPVSPEPEQTRTLHERAYAPDSVAFFPPGAQFDVAIVSQFSYPWTPRGAKVGLGTSVRIGERLYEVLVIDRPRQDLVRYFLSVWPEQAIIRRVFDYTPDVVRQHVQQARNRTASAKSGSLGDRLTTFFGKLRKDE